VCFGLAIPVLAFILFARYWASRKRSSADDPLNILAQRLAKGEITEQQYHALRTAIEGTPSNRQSP